MEEQITAKRHGFITFWLWLGIICGIICFIASIVFASQANTIPNPLNYKTMDEWTHAVWVYEHASSIITICIFYALVCLADACASFLLLQRKKLGFKIRIATAAVSVILAFIYGLSIAQEGGVGPAFGMALGAAVGSAVGIGILYAILNIRKDGVPYWNQLQ